MTAKSEMTPSRSGRTAKIVEGVRPTMSFASLPMASTRFETVSIATTDGSSMTMPRPAHAHQRVRRPEIDADVMREHAEE